jgi:hypothetical protein
MRDGAALLEGLADWGQKLAQLGNKPITGSW